MKRFIAASLVALAAAGLYFGMPAESKANGISLSINLGRPGPVIVPAGPAVIGAGYYGPAPIAVNPYPVVAAYPAPLPGPICGTHVIVRPPLVVPTVGYRPAYYPGYGHYPHQHPHHGR